MRSESYRRKEACKSLFDLFVGLSIASHILALHLKKLLRKYDSTLTDASPSASGVFYLSLTIEVLLEALILPKNQRG